MFFNNYRKNLFGLEEFFKTTRGLILFPSVAIFSNYQFCFYDHHSIYCNNGFLLNKSVNKYDSLWN